MARLVIIEGVNAGHEFSFDRDVTMGRSVENAVSLADQRVSRHHARIIRQGTHYVIEDLESANGTMLQGKQLLPGTLCQLTDGDEIVLGSTRLMFQVEDDQPERTHDTAIEEPVLTSSEAIALTVGDDMVNSEVSVALDATASMTAIMSPAEQTPKELSDAFKRLQAMCQVSIALGAITNRDLLMQKLLDCLLEIFPTIDRAFIVLLEKDGMLVPVAARNRQGGQERDDIAISHTILNEVITHKRSILSFDALRDDRFSRHESVINYSIRSVMCAPLLIEGQVLGFIQVDTCTGLQMFTAEELQLLTGISAQAAIAVKNAQLYHESSVANQALQKEVVERKRIEQALRKAHDELEMRVAERTADLRRVNTSLQQEIAERRQVELQLQEAKEAAEQANQAKSQFLRNMSHELRTPLTVMLGNLPLLTTLEALPEPKDIVEISQDIENAGQHLLVLINDLLDLSKVEAGKMTLNFEALAARDVVDDAVSTVAVMLREKGLECETHVADVRVWADHVRLKQILLNLLSNAIKFTTQGKLVLEVERHGDMAHFRVRDTGCGIEEENLQHIFDTFMQLKPISGQSASGTGLGLSIVKKLVELHGGRVMVESSVGSGSVFTIAIPVAQ